LTTDRIDDLAAVGLNRQAGRVDVLGLTHGQPVSYALIGSSVGTVQIRIRPGLYLPA